MSAPVYALRQMPMRGALYALLASVLFAMQDALVKWLAADFSLFQLLFVRSMVSVPLLILFISYRAGRAGFKTRRPAGHALRAVFNFAAFLSYYFAVSRMPLADAASIAMASPLFMVLLSGLILAEKPQGKQWLAMICGFVGVLFIVQPTGEQVDWPGALAALLGTFMFAALAIQTRRLSASESSELMVLTSASAFLVVTGCLMPLVWHTPGMGDLLLMLFLGLVSVSAQYCIVTGFSYAPVYVVGPLEYTTLLWAIMFGWLLFGDLPTWIMLAGATLVVGSGLFVVFSARRGAST